MNKSLLTNLVALSLCILGYIIPSYGNFLFNTGIFALSGSLTNWLAIHMLFEKVPFLYGSGVIPNRFEDFKVGIKALIVKEFFSAKRIKGFTQDSSLFPSIESKVDYDQVFLELTNAIEASSLGGLLSMVGGKQALEPLKEPITEKVKEMIHNLQKETLEDEKLPAQIAEKIETLIDSRLNELTPNDIKEIIQKMIKEHLGWLVVWGGIFGGLIGLVIAFIDLSF